MPRIFLLLPIFLLLLNGQSSLAKTPRMPALNNWGYQLQKIRPKQIAKSHYDLMVIDFSKDGSGRKIFSKKQVAMMKRKPDGSRRILLAYLSIGEAENYRDYWRKRWNRSSPKWLGKENKNWKGNFLVRYWFPEWQDFIFGAPNAYLDRIMAAGFDGVYLDRVDAYEAHKKRRPTAAKDMIKFVSDLAKYANKKRKFYVMAQNAEGLAVHKKYTDVISAIGKEDLLYGVEHNGNKNSDEEVFWSAKYLKKAQDAGLHIFVVEYLKSPAKRMTVRKKLKKLNMTPLFAHRDLNKLKWK